MKNNEKDLLIKFYEETINKLEIEKKKWKMFKQVTDSFQTIQNHSREQIENLKKTEAEP